MGATCERLPTVPAHQRSSAAGSRIIILSMVDSVHGLDHSVAESAPTLARSGDAACAVERDAAVLANASIAYVGGAPGHVPLAKLRPCA